ncbi:MAG: hypothetical protein QT12_C0007G0025 [archaeon GW2011_AR21]|uniref:HIT domain-containing protein n=2 Tax=Candidatus Iainarchaeum sp. TaxID=3101447 RepID=A0A7J4JZ36_9ARCH|nr:MAG: hypothetical protein QT12_C0007G0025 [archaeon GW2011_AR21]HIH21919.1 HIT domain-containing protein [Candidatus Diapherotrites archaeon]
MEECAFCKEFRTGVIELKDIVLKRKVLHESKHFVVFPSLGQITEGYLLIVPKKHHLSIASIPKTQFGELEKVVEKVKKVLAENYCSPIIFEHGCASETKRAGCCIDHAHLHAVPAKASIAGELARKFKSSKIKDYKSLALAKKKPYFFVEEEGSKRLFQIPNAVPSQYIRKLLAFKIGEWLKWDWRVYLGIEELKATEKKLEGKF